MIKAAFI